jgi:TRAP-type C4-dicarboxylate transport system permease small subunit
MSDTPEPQIDHSPLARLAQLVTAIAGVALIGIALTEFWQVVARYVFNRSPSWTEPVVLICISTALMGAAAVGVRNNRHFGFLMLAEKAPPRLRRALQMFAGAVACAVGVIFAIAGGKLVAESWDYSMAGAAVPQGAVYIPLCIGGALIAIFAAEHAARVLRAPLTVK